ncbi:unnamed protein product [Paramecium octaurelia]|uniref:UvrD-like helicase C-terminal domain-containing protein n=1 Tax=Paramecium octaurelia TaxID=43137 RepID=A0A8S1YM98_PAROT|nr:unnamed protein product [Paramecium octaurelia]
MRQLEKDQAEFIKERNYFNMMQEIKNKSIIRFTDEDKKEMDLYLEKKQLMNINFLDERDVHHSEKGLLYLKDVDPRLQKIILKIGETGTASLEIGDKAFQHSVNLQKGQMIRALSDVEEALLTTYDFVSKTLQRNPTYAQAGQKIRKYLLDSEYMELFGIDYVNGHFGMEYLERSIIQIKFIIQKLPNTCQVQISQIPINLGYARTIHCSQGSTFENVIMDLDMPERQQSGLLYTALSRVRRMDNLYLSGKLNQSMFKVRVSNQIKKFYEENIVEVSKYLENDSLKELLEKDFKDLLEQINEMSSDLRQALIQLKLEKVKIQNH